MPFHPEVLPDYVPTLFTKAGLDEKMSLQALETVQMTCLVHGASEANVASKKADYEQAFGKLEKAGNIIGTLLRRLLTC